MNKLLLLLLFVLRNYPQIQNKTKQKLYSNSTGNSSLCSELSKHIWHLKDAKIEFNVTWKILKQAAPFNPASNCCVYVNCAYEKNHYCRPDLVSLNK